MRMRARRPLRVYALGVRARCVAAAIGILMTVPLAHADPLIQPPAVPPSSNVMIESDTPGTTLEHYESGEFSLVCKLPCGERITPGFYRLNGRRLVPTR